MTVAAALGSLYALRCDGVEDGRHYAIGAVAPDLPDQPTIYWRFSDEEWPFAPEVYDLQAGGLGVGVRLTLLVSRYHGVGQAAQLLALPGWVDRVLAMLATDMLLGDALTEPLSGFLRRVGVIQGLQAQYVGIDMNIRLSVRIEAP